MKILGQCDTDNNYTPYAKPYVVTQIEDRLIEREFGTIVGIRDSYGHWVSPHMHKLGLKCLLKIEE